MNLCSDCHCLAEREHCELVVVFSSYLSPFVDEEVKILGWSRFVHFIQAVSLKKVSHQHSVLNVKWVHHQGSFQEQPNRCRRDGLELHLAVGVLEWELKASASSTCLRVTWRRAAVDPQQGDNNSQQARPHIHNSRYTATSAHETLCKWVEMKQNP